MNLETVCQSVEDAAVKVLRKIGVGLDAKAEDICLSKYRIHRKTFECWAQTYNDCVSNNNLAGILYSRFSAAELQTQLKDSLQTAPEEAVDWYHNAITETERILREIEARELQSSLSELEDAWDTLRKTFGEDDPLLAKYGKCTGSSE